jgi:malate dehydrogenase (oxaloacetate-decarboxylating)(NADP+)
MKIAAAKALASIAKLPIPDEVRQAMPGRDFTFGRDYVIPTPFDPRLIEIIPIAVAKAAAESAAEPRDSRHGGGTKSGSLSLS